MTIEYRKLMGQPRGLTILYVFAERTFGVDAPPSKRFMLSFFDPAESDIKGSPFDPAPSGRVSAEDAKATDYWFSGTPSRFETSLRRSLVDFTQTLNRLYPELHGANQNPSKETWWLALPRLAALKEEGLLRRRGNECKRPYLSVNNQRIVYFPDTLPPQIYPHSVPLSLWSEQ